MKEKREIQFQSLKFLFFLFFIPCLHAIINYNSLIIITTTKRKGKIERNKINNKNKIL